MTYGSFALSVYRDIFSTDMDGDGYVDLVTTHNLNDELIIFFNDGNGFFPNSQYYAVGDETSDFILEDFNNDSKPDVAVSSSVPGRNYVYIFTNGSHPATAIEESGPHIHLPEDVTLFQNYPNPFNPVTTIHYSVGGYVGTGISMVETPSMASLHIDLTIYNTLGQKITTLVSEKQYPGKYSVQWNAAGWPSGVYFYKLSNNQGFTQTKKLVLLR
jgi:hypothetical protein